MEFQIQGKRALVTGAGRGIGRAIALALAKEGVIVAGISQTASDLSTLVDEMGGSNCGHYYLADDVTEEKSPERLVEKLHKEFGPIDIVVHNVGGTLNVTDPLCSVADWRKVWRFNFEVAVEFNRLLVPAMQDKKWGRIVHISSIASMENQGPVTYCSVKAALTAYTRSIGRVLSPDGIAVTAVLPGAIFTEGGYWDTASQERPEHVKKYLEERMASKRFGHTDEIANFVAFLCSEHASFCIGSIIPIDGGQGRTFFGL